MSRSKKDAEIFTPCADSPNSRRVLIVAGEASADLHGANLVRAMKERARGLNFCGIGGDGMQKAGVRILYSSAEMAVVGLTEVLSKAAVIFRASRHLKSLLRKARPDLLILMDYPGFNINLARSAKRWGVPVLYYISPQVWAWRKGRVRKIARRVDRMAVILPFEEAFYRKRGMAVDYVGHPLLDAVPETLDRQTIRREMGFREEDRLLGLLPGSRAEEVRRLFPTMLQAAEILSARSCPGLKGLVPIAPTVSMKDIQPLAETAALDIRLFQGEAYRVLSACDLAFVASGTATLEAGILGTPMVIVYRVSPISYWIAKRVVDISHVGLVNLVAETPFVPELLQDRLTPEHLAREAEALLEKDEAGREMTRSLQALRRRLGGGSPSAKTAEIALEMMEKGRNSRASYGTNHPDRR